MPELSSLAAPAAAAASLAYLNARWSLSSDLRSLSALARARIHVARLTKKDHINIFYTLEEHAHNKAVADKPFLVYESKTWTFRQTYDTALCYAGWLHNTHHVVPGEIIALDCMNSPTFIFLTLALWSLGATPAFINYNLTGQPLIHSIRASTARIVLVDSEVKHRFTQEVLDTISSPTFRNNAMPVSLVTLTPQLLSSLPYFPAHRAPDSVRSGAVERSPAVLIFTSGTTGLPKPAIVPWLRLLVGSHFTAHWMGLRKVTSKRPDRYYTCMPLYHSTAFALCFNICLGYGVTFVLGHQFSTTHFWDEVRAGKATVIQYVGETLRYLMSAPPNPDLDRANDVRIAFGNGLRPDVWERFKARFGVDTIAEFYGATEAPSASWNLSSNTFSSGAIGQFGAIGELLIGSRMAVVKVDWETEEPYRDAQTGYCVRAPRGDPGEFLYKLNAADIGEAYVGYFGNKAASEKKILLDVLQKGDAWFRTGDIVRLDKEGRLWFTDRIGDTFRWKSENVSTAEVSQVLGHHPHILDANVYGVEVPGHEGRAGCAAILLKQQQQPDAELLEGLATFARNSLPKYGVPVFLRVVKSVRTTGNNKQEKHLLRQQGADPSKMEDDRLYWLKPGASAYEAFGMRQWDELNGGKVKL